MPSSLKDLLDVATNAAYVAGRRTLAYFNAEVAIETKPDDTPVTRADREAEQVIREKIARVFPTHSILGEEGGESRGDPDHKWIIDPIDGTKSFVKGVPMYGVMIGVEVRGKPAVGAVYLPATDEMIAAAEGHGCTWNSRRARVSSVDQLKDATLLAGSITRCIARSDAFDRLSQQVKLNRGWGDVYGHIMVATGRAEIMLDPLMNPWDCAALVPIIQEASGHFTTWQGEPTIYGPDGVSTNGALHRTIIDILKSEKRRGGDMRVD